MHSSFNQNPFGLVYNHFTRKFRNIQLRQAHAITKKRTLKEIDKLLQKDLQIKLDIGAGQTKRTADWLTLDKNRCCDLYWDLSDGIPFPDNTVTSIYSSHVLEHITPGSLETLLRDCLRCLKPGGSISVCVPNARLFIEAYIQGRYFVTPSSDHCWRRGWVESGSPIDQLNYIAYMGGEHKFMFDQASLIGMLNRAGFEQTAARDFEDNLDLHERRFVSIYAVAYKKLAK
ncbi:methyltransferase domain-containing protein [Synechococcus sp. CBW1004]|uniref:class I SAM-dependent methyltransferase n=1 Tax=Synechococcus sp. CBW1004 TaxID=1353136 RepID=UPI0018CEF4CF|nr:methyltransferase domain-containing protein [Synechococcus sp. CBW1004]QPN64316.1 methyltransferase domain-containing protein [Synechococcus sp. CBW1004]